MGFSFPPNSINHDIKEEEKKKKRTFHGIHFSPKPHKTPNPKQMQGWITAMEKDTKDIN